MRSMSEKYFDLIASLKNFSVSDELDGDGGEEEEKWWEGVVVLVWVV